MSFFQISPELAKKLIANSYWVVEDSNFFTTRALVQSRYELNELEVPQDIIESINKIAQSLTCKIYRYIADSPSQDCFEPPFDVIFPQQLTKKLPKQNTLMYGELVKTVYFDDYANGEFMEPIVEIIYEYSRDELGFLLSKTQTINWYTESGTIHHLSKINTSPVSSKLSQQSEIRERRKNIVLEAETKALELGISFAIQAIYDKYDREVSKYLSAGSTSLAQAINNDSEFAWLDQPTPEDPNLTIRQFLVSFFNIGAFT